MTQFRKLARGSLLAAAGVCVFAFAGMGLSSIAEAKKATPAPQEASQAGEDSKLSPEEQKKKASREAYDAGLKDFANGRYQSAIDQLATALKTGGLSSTEMAKALYTRGVAYKKQKQPGLAISDLTSALWLKNGLSASERETAMAERVDAYKMAGIQDTGKGPERVVGTPNPTPATTTTAAAASPSASGPNAGSAGLSAAAIAQAAASSNSSNASDAAQPITRQDPSSAQAQDAARARAAYAPVNSFAGSTVTSGGQPAPAAQAQAPAPAQSSSFGSGVTGFFSNIFGGSSSAPATSAQVPAGVTTASTGPVAETSSWSNATIVNEGGSAKAASKKPQEAAGAKTATKGKYKVHIAALRSRADAEALAQQLIAQHGADLDNHVPTVDEAVIGSMGTFYRVRIGGYASQEEPQGLCNKLRTSGLDCLVVTN